MSQVGLRGTHPSFQSFDKFLGLFRGLGEEPLPGFDYLGPSSKRRTDPPSRYKTLSTPSHRTLEPRQIQLVFFLVPHLGIIALERRFGSP